MYKQLYKEHLNLQRSFNSLCLLIKEGNGISCGFEKHVLRWLREKQKLESIVVYFRSQVERLQRELQESNERSELREFCLLEYLIKASAAENVVESVNVDPFCSTLSDYWTPSSSLPETKDNSGCFVAAKEPGIMSQQLPDVAPAEDPGGGGGMPGRNIMTAVMELQSLVEWTAQRKGVKEDPAVVNEKLRQLDKIRKELELEKSARLQDAEVSHAGSIADSNGKSEMAFPLDTAVKTVQDPSEKIIAPLICDPDVPYPQPVQEPKMDLHRYSVCAMEDCFHLDDLPPPVDEHNCDSALEENNLDLYINFVSAKEQIQQLTMDLEAEQEVKSSDKVDSRHHATDEPDSLGTAISEDEGLGEESRRADSTGSNSFLDIHTSEEDLVDSNAGASSEQYPKEAEPSSKTDVVWINDPQDPRLSVELCRCTIYKLKECLKAREEQLKRIREEHKDNNQIKVLQTHVNNLRNDLEELRSRLEVALKENSELKEQVLELEEAENDSRRQCQRYEEKVLFLQEKDAHFQSEFLETKQTLEACMDTLTARDAKEKEFKSQLKYMEVLVQKYEDQIKALEVSEFKLREKIALLEEQLLKFRNSKNNVQHKGTQTYPPRLQASGSKMDCGEKQCDWDEIRKAELELIGSDEPCDTRKGDVAFSEVGVQVNLTGCSVECEIEKEQDLHTGCESSSPTGDLQTLSTNSSLISVVGVPQESVPGAEPGTTLSSACPFQHELFRRLHHLVEEDAHLQQQLHHMDQINLTLWQKLHSLEFHIGECKKENFQHHTGVDDEARTADVTSPVCIPYGDSSSQQLTGKSQPLHAGEEEHFISSGKMISLDFNEDGLKDRLLRLEKINSTFEAELRNREKLYQKKEQKHKEWMEAEDRFTCDIQYLQMEKNSLLAKVAQLETEKQRLTNRFLEMVDELSSLKERHRRQISLITEEHEALVSELRSRIELLTKKEKEYVGQISNLRMEKKSSVRKEIAAGEKSELENLKASYVQLQIELSQNRNNMTKMENEFEDRLEALKQNHLSEEAKLEEDLKRLQEKEADFDEQLNSFQKRQSELEAALIHKEQQLESARLEFKEQVLVMEEEHRTVETELNRKLRQMEESTAVATKALTEEKVRLEKELQENLYDLRTKEEHYKSRISELEANVSQLHVELRRLTGDLDAGFPECEGTELPQFQKERLQKQLQELQRREGDLREKLEDMEQKEAAYRETLENADRIVASVERGYKNKIEELEMSERSLKQRVNHLEEIESKLRVALHRERRSSDGRKPDDLVLELLEAEVRENTLKERIESLEQNHRTTTQKLKEVEKIRQSLEDKMADHEELVISLDRLQQEHDTIRKENAKLRISESGLRLALQQAEGMLKSREIEMRNEMERMQEEKKDLEETIHQLRMQVRQLQTLVDCSHEEEASGETLSESVQRSESLESKGSEISESGEPIKTSPVAEDEHIITDDLMTTAERIRSVTFQESCETLTSPLDEPSTEADLFPPGSENSSFDKDSIDNILFDTDDAGTVKSTGSNSPDAWEQDRELSPATIEFFLPEPKKLQYELVETDIPELIPVQETTTPVATPDSTTAESAKDATEMAEEQTSNVDSQPKLDQPSPVTEEIEKSTNTDSESTAKTNGANVASENFKESQTAESSITPKESTKDTAAEMEEEDSKDLLSISIDSLSSEPVGVKTSEPTSEALLSGDQQVSCPDSVGSNEADSTNKQTPVTDSENTKDDVSQKICDIQLLSEETSVDGTEPSTEGNTGVPADSILKLLRGLRPGSSAVSPCSSPRSKIRTLLKQHCVAGEASAEVTSQDSEKKDLLPEDPVDWLKVAQESESKYSEEKKVLEEEVKLLREKADTIEKEKKALQQSLKKTEDLETLRETNAKLQEQVSLLQRRLNMASSSGTVEAKKDVKPLTPESIPKPKEAKTEKKHPEETLKKEISVASGSVVASFEVTRPILTSPQPPVDECRKERMQLEENMIRAMVAMQFDMQQKKAAKMFNPAYGGSDTSTRPKGQLAQGEVVTMGACAAEVKDDGASSSTSKSVTVHSPFNFRVVQQVGSDTVLVGWEHAHPMELEGFEVYVNGALHETVYTPDRTKAVISGLDMQQPLTLSVCAVSRLGDISEPQLLHLPQGNGNSKDGFFFSDDEDDDDYDDIFYADDDNEKHSRPYSMEW